MQTVRWCRAVLKETVTTAPDGHPFRIATLRNHRGMVVTVMDWGATLLSCRVPMHDGSTRECLLGCPGPESWIRQDAFLGASIGRYANRIAYSRFTLDGQSIVLQPSQGEHQLHGGPEGFDKRRWIIMQQNESEVHYAFNSHDGDQGFPGELHTTVQYRLTKENGLTIAYYARVNKPCPVNLTSHAYFNLDGKQSDVRNYRLQLFASRWDAQGIPTRDLEEVAGTGFDFRHPKTIVQDFMCDDAQKATHGYNHAFLLDAPNHLEHPVAPLWSADGALQMSVFTTAPALQFYTGNFLDGTPARKQGEYLAWQGLALESGFLPDSPNHPEWPQPNVILRPSDTYRSVTEYRFTPLLCSKPSS